ncbi:hypothetical protein HY091_02990 [Candidatus Kaiserbacteria bacterium]|nr:hypothetical protein [Candidatus Kaiserbacteria bacterium]
MKKYLGLGIALALVITPISFVFADEGESGGGYQQWSLGPPLPPGPGAQIEESAQPQDLEEDASSTGEDNGPSELRPMMPLGLMHRGERNQEASSTENGYQGKEHGIPFLFWSWLFGLPATTTVGELRAELQASSTASSSPPVPRAERFFRHFFRFFGFGGGD